MSNEGIVYFVQPAVLLGTNRYKIGCSSNIARLNSYHSGTRHIEIINCNDYFAVENEIKKRFNEKFILCSGKEFFEGNEDEMKQEFCKIVSEFTTKNISETDTKNTSKNDIKTTVEHSYDCNYCNYSTIVKHHFQKHLLSKKHKKNEKQMKLMEEHKMFSCNTCEYHTKTKQNYNKHMQSKRHLEKEAGNLNSFTCDVCDKPFGSYSGMLRHQKKCAIKTISENKQVQNAIQLLQPKETEQSEVKLLQDEIKELKNIIMSLVKKDHI